MKEMSLFLSVVSMLEEDEASTDLGSGCSCSSSDAEVSSASPCILGGRQHPSIVDTIDRGTLLLQHRGGAARKGARGGYGRRVRRCFKGTPLETIPGTPVAKSGQREQFLYGLPSSDGNISPLPCVSAPAVATTMVSRDVPVKPPGVWTTSEVVWGKSVGGAVARNSVSMSICTESLRWPWHVSAGDTAASSDSDASSLSFTSAPPLLYGRVLTASPVSPERRAREATIASAKWQGLPLKVRPPSGCDDLERRFNAAIAKGIDTAGPVKKRPVFAEVAGEMPAAILRNLQPNLPVKKIVPDFFLLGESHLFALPPYFGAIPPASSTILSSR
eukprot:TRINITY_DN4697_c0_g1_i1.p1 TRINITY_DN4697_c0_g1~~TRINITY_DN4697_c0_g1_i1.p1  ORF type:complete len:356 (-),score=57.37 TRINITY_DN4697_c0_g1_i1:157-1149(-)